MSIGTLDPELRRQMALARELYAHHEYDRAEPLLREIVAQHPGSAEMFNLLGVIAHHRGRYDEAQRLLEQALHINPGYTEAALNLAVIYNDTGRYGEAQQVYGEAMRRSGAPTEKPDPFARGKLANMHAATAEAYRGLCMYAEAADEYRRALGLCPTFPDLHCQLGMTLSEAGRREEAVEALRQAIAHNPSYVQARVLLGAELYALGRREEARAAWQEALSLDPQNRRIQVYLNLK